jgi:hypothetical protein
MPNKAHGGASTLRSLLYSREANLKVNIIGHAFKAMQGELGTMHVTLDEMKFERMCLHEQLGQFK